MSSNNMFPIMYRPTNFKGFLSDFLADRVLKHTTAKRVEIELRKGRFLGTGKHTKIPDFAKNMSMQSPVLFGGSLPATQGTFFHTAFSISENFPYRFDSSLEESHFYDLVGIMNDNFPPEAKQTEFTVDFSLRTDDRDASANGGRTTSRFTWDLHSNAFAENSKLDKENIDILHQGHEYRLSVCFEVGDRIRFADFAQRMDAQGMKGIRAKFRQNFTYQFFKLFFTCVWTLESKGDQQRLLALLKAHEGVEDLTTSLEDRVMAILNTSKASKTFEVECEVIDVDVLRGYITHNDRGNFNALLDRFFRNFELLYYAPTSLELRDYRKHLEEKGVDSPPKPVIGNYLDTLLKKSK